MDEFEEFEAAVAIRQCHSFNRQGQRCEHPAGHPGNHIVTAEWSDEEAWVPNFPREASPLMGRADGHLAYMTVPEPVADAPNLAAVMEQVTYAESQWEQRGSLVDVEALAQIEDIDPHVIRDATPSVLGGPCIACGHMHASGKCRCDCETYVPSVAR
jgi:hypothetical protein